MTFIQKSFQPQIDLTRMISLILANPEHHLHVVDLPYRLASWALNDLDNVALWEDEQGQLIAWAVAQQPFSSLDYAIHPNFPELENPVLTWGKHRWQTIAQERLAQTYFYISARDDQAERIANLELHGFQRDSWSLHHMARSLTEPILDTPTPEGFTIRPLIGQSEAAVYTELHRAAFGSENMREEWRARTLLSPGYTPDMDLVAVAPDGSLAAFCICWLCHLPDQQIWGQVEPIGVHPNYQGRGLGHALLSEGLRRMQAHGATQAFIEAESNNPVSQHLYQEMGYQIVYEAHAYFSVALL